MRDVGPERAWSYALNLLSRRPCTVAEVRERLARKGVEPPLVEEVIERLARYRLVDDHAFAESYVRSRRRAKGSIALRHELRRKGVPPETSERALEPLDEEAEAASARRLLERNAWRFRTGDTRRNRARAFAFLARRGFPGDVVVATLEQADWLEADGNATA